MGGDIEKAAKKFPKTSFGIIDYSQSFMKSDPQNLRGALFSENESGYLMGVAAAMATKTNGVSAVGGQAVPAVVSYLAGFKAGAKATKKGIKVHLLFRELHRPGEVQGDRAEPDRSRLGRCLPGRG